MRGSERFPLLVMMLAMMAAACGGDGEGKGSGSDALDVSWSFESGDCASHGIETVKVTVTPEGGEPEEASFDCAAGSGEVGTIDEAGGTYDVTAEGLDADGVVRAESFGSTLNVGEGAASSVFTDIALHPSPSDVQVTWTTGGTGPCPRDVVLPYHITLYTPPAEAGGPLTEKVTEIQETCSSGAVTLTNVAPGDYVVEVDSRAVTPAVRGTAPVTVTAGEAAQVAVEL